ncbi:MAG: exopolysaccharide biosynthesis protein [Burkholderiales bacterium]|jgi:hypothetical protein|nr:exopolysaccharide biosynthesis protein [Burkholderiales bacterium]MCA3162708.1 exopolysaccharide biosynthesis protein [Burkholderiales bacterium]MCA3164643.1 exopolysaccharide biosynthesis protein [Burkholderiales bacterium]MCA3166470.1 exopolysaccharide biosynthesis protein [Burkholderiales bacterium]MCA3171267.1 exopolysaccharide biosynthesis protein [Burkholderiales bacterium]
MSLRDKLHQLIQQLPEDRASVQSIVDSLGREAFVFLALVLTLPFLVPVSIPGISTVFGAVIALIGVSIMLNRDPWLPQRYLKREFSSARLRQALAKGADWLHRLEKFSQPRWHSLVAGHWMIRVNGFMMLVAALLLMAPFGFVPFTNTLPGIAIIFLCLGLLQNDGRSIALGYVANLLTVVYFGLILGLGATAVSAGLQHIAPWSL